MIPGRSLVIACLLLLPLAVSAFFLEAWLQFWLLAVCGMAVLLVVDGLLLFLATGVPVASRDVPKTLALDERCEATLVFGLQDRRLVPRVIEVFDIFPESMSSSAFPLRLKAAHWQKRKQISLMYELKPVIRGNWHFEAVDVRVHSLLGFWIRKVRQNVPSSGRTYPDFRSIIRLADQDLRGLMELSGLKNTRRRGQGLEFMSLREYTPDDSVRAIDWRATSRRGKPIVRDYTDDQDQQLLFVLDSGYRLNRREEGHLQFDTALNSVLLLSYVALKHQDSVGFMSFGNEERWLAPRKGLSTLSLLQNNVYDLHCAAVPSSPFAALEKALEHLKRRTFIVLISNLREEDGESLSWILPRIRQKHLLLAVSLKEVEADAALKMRPGKRDEYLEKAAALAYSNARQSLYKKWEHSGLLTLEASSKKLSAGLINSYLAVKRSGRL